MLNTIITPDGRRKVCKVYDAGEASADRYTVIMKAFRYDGKLVYPYLSCDDRPSCPQGFGQYSDSLKPIEGAHLGKRVAFDELPPDTQKFILARI